MTLKLLQHPLTAAIGLALAGMSLGGCIINPQRGESPAVGLPQQFHHASEDALQQPDSSAAEIARTLRSWPVGPLEKSPLAASGKSDGSAIDTSSLPTPLEEAPTEATSLGEALPQWWRLLGNSELNGLIDRALANNQDIRIANLRIAQAKARADQADADRYPTVTVPLKATMEAPRDGVGTVRKGDSVPSRKVFEASIRGDWRADLWGEKAAMLESSDQQVWRAEFQRDDVQRKLVADLTKQYLVYLSLTDRIKVARETETVLSGMLNSVEARMQKGDATAIEVQQQRAAVYAVKATIPTFEQQREAALNAIAQLAGSYPGQLHLRGDTGLDTLAYPTISPGTPASLLFRRPDIRAVESRMLAAGADITVARARVLPPLDLSAQIGYGSLHLTQLLQPYNLMWNLVASMVGTIFDHGKRDKEVEFSKAVHEEMVETYVRSVYQAVREVEDALNASQMTEKSAKSQLESTAAAREAYIFSHEAYSAGAIDYLTLLDTERTYHRSLDELHRMRMEHYRAMVDLFEALGGGVEAPPQENDTGTVTAIAPLLPDAANNTATDAMIENDQATWVAELTGMYERERIAPLWRDLRERFPQWMEQRAILPRLTSRAPISEPADSKVSLYRLYVSRFDSEEEASEFCAELEAGQIRCKPFHGAPQKEKP
jgi:NodT family efflux transporter outer membrane factor (OMF) lipoprotein